MPVQIKVLNGVMDTDSSNETIGLHSHKYAKNIRFVNGRPEIIKGTRLIPNSFLPSTGINECIGCFYDQKKQRIFFFIWNSVGLHGIHIYYTKTNTFSLLLQVGAGTDGDILAFNLQRYITSIDVIYGSEEDGDLLIFLDSLKRPTKLNIDRYLSGTYSIVKRDFIDVAKAPFSTPPQVTYENDATVTVNNLKNSLFQFVSRPVYDDNEKPVFGGASIVPLPDAPFDYQVDTDATKNARIALYIPTGDKDVKKLEIICRQSKSGGTTSYFLITSLNKSELSIPDNDVYRYVFLNDGIYTFLDEKEASLLFDYVPREANAQAILNGNVPIYGAIKEGYNQVLPNFSSLSTTSLLPYSTYNGVLFYAFQNNDNQITIYLTGTGVNDVNGNPTTLTNPPANLYVKCTDGSFVDNSFSYANASSSIPTILAGVSAAAVAQGFVQVSIGTNTLVLSNASGVKLNSSGVLRDIATTFNTNETVFCFAPEANYSFGVQYYDDKGRTNGVVNSVAYNIKTQAYGTNGELPLVELTISHRPPIWASYYELARTNDLTYEKRLHWVSKGAFETFSPTGTKRYAYIDVSNISEYNIDIKATDGVVSYDFAPGDRISFIARRPFGSSRVVLPHLDYEIVGLQGTININGTVKSGNFIQIVYPTADISSDFKFDGSFDFLHYEVLIYSYKPHADNTTNVYYGFGRKYNIGNAGTVNAYHIGQEQTQSPDLITSAKINISEGDYFYRSRSVPVGITNEYNMPGYDNGFADTTTIHIDVPGSPVVTPYYRFASTIYAAGSKAAGSYPLDSSTNCIFQNLTASSLRLRIKTTFTFTNDFDVPNFELFVKMVNNPIPVASVVIYDLVALTGGLVANQSHTFEIDATITVYAGSKVFPMVYKTGSQTFHSAGTWSFEVLDNDDLFIIEKSFSDVYAIKTNSNSRETVIDENAKEQFLPTMLRWGLAYESNSNVNQINRFYELNFDEIDRANGDIQRFIVEERNLYAYQNRGVGVLGIYAKFLQDSGNTNVVTTTDEIITKNNVRYLVGEYGLGNHPESLVRAKSAHYFIDPVRGYLVRRAADGLTPISEKYLGQFYIRSLLTPYNKDWTTSNGGVAKCFGYYDFFDEQYVPVLQAGVNGINSINNYAFSFNEPRNAFCSFYDYTPDWITCAEDVTYSWKNGDLYIHDNVAAGNYAQFYGVNYNAQIQLVFNDNVHIKKTFNSISYQANVYWLSPTSGDIFTSQPNPQTGLMQISKLQIQDYDIQEGIYYAAFLRDQNSMQNQDIALFEGDYLKGVLICVSLVYSGNNYSFLYLPTVNYSISQRNL